MKMKLLLAILAWAQPNASLAASVLPLASSVLVSVDSRNEGRRVGRDNLSAVDSSSAKTTIRGLQQSVVVFGAGEPFVFTTYGDRVPAGTLFHGTFSDPVDLVAAQANQARNCSVNKPLIDIQHTVSSMETATINGTSGTCHLEPTNGGSDNSRNITLPELNSISLLATGLVGLAGLVHRRRRIVVGSGRQSSSPGLRF